MDVDYSQLLVAASYLLLFAFGFNGAYSGEVEQ